eukprot:s2105_g5.t1
MSRRPFGQPVKSRGLMAADDPEPPPAPGEDPSPRGEKAVGMAMRAVSTRTPTQHRAEAEPPAAPEEWDSPRDVHGEGNASQAVSSAWPPKHSPTPHSSLPVRSPAFHGAESEPPPAPEEALDKDQVRKPAPSSMQARHSPSSSQSTRSPMSMTSSSQHRAEAEPPAAPEEWDSPRDVHGEGNVSQAVSPSLPAKHPPSSSHSSPLSARNPAQHKAEAEPAAAPEEWDSTGDVLGEGNVSQAASPSLPAKHPPSSSHSSPLPIGSPAQHKDAENEPLPAPEEALDKGEVSPAMSLASNPSLSSALKGEDRPRSPSVKRSVSFSEPPESPVEPGDVAGGPVSNELSLAHDTGGVEEAPESKVAPVELLSCKANAAKAHSDWQKQQLAEGIILLKKWTDSNAALQLCVSNKKLSDMKFTVNIGASTNLDRLDRESRPSHPLLMLLQSHVVVRYNDKFPFCCDVAKDPSNTSQGEQFPPFSACFWQDFAKPEGSRGAKTCTVLAAAAADTDVCELRQVDHHQSSRILGMQAGPPKLSMAFNWEPQQVQREELQKLTSAEQQRRRELATELEQQGVTSSRMTASEIKDACSRAGISKFVDADFMPCDESLFQKSSHDHPAVMWKRPEDFCKGSFQIFSNDILPSDIKQGALGDCWFLAALAAVAEDPDLIRRLFGDTKVNKHGVYEIKCFKNGRPTSIVVDDFLPCSPNSGLPCYAHIDIQGRNQNELWVMLLEKAWAKLHGCYERIESGMPYRALMDLLGAAGKEYHLETEKHPDGLIAKDKFFSMLCKYDQAGYLMVAGTPGSDTFTKGDKSQIPLSGLIPGHAYTLLSAHEANGVRLLRLRNPWGDHEWTGDWSDKSSLWTQAMKDAVKPKPSFDANDGEFWMCYQDFLSHFSSVGVVFLSDSWATTRNMLSTDGTDMCRQVVSIRSSSPIKKGFITLFQQDARMQGAPPYTQLSFALYGPLEDGKPQAEVLRSHLWPVRELVEEIPHSKPLPAGEYLVAIFTPNKVPDRQLTLVLQLDVAGHCEVTTKEADDEMRKTLALASALSGPARAIGPASTRGAWLPNGGYALAASCAPRSKALAPWALQRKGEVCSQKGHEIQEITQAMSFDFSRCKGLALRGDGTKDPEEMRLIGDLQPMASKKSFSVSTSYQEQLAKMHSLAARPGSLKHQLQRGFLESRFDISFGTFIAENPARDLP